MVATAERSCNLGSTEVGNIHDKGSPLKYRSRPINEGSNDGGAVRENVWVVPISVEDEGSISQVRVKIAAVFVRFHNEARLGAEMNGRPCRAPLPLCEGAANKSRWITPRGSERSEEPSSGRGLPMRPSDSQKGTTTRGGGICDHLLNGNDRQTRLSRCLELRVVRLRARDRL